MLKEKKTSVLKKVCCILLAYNYFWDHFRKKKFPEVLPSNEVIGGIPHIQDPRSVERLRTYSYKTQFNLAAFEAWSNKIISWQQKSPASSSQSNTQIRAIWEGIRGGNLRARLGVVFTVGGSMVIACTHTHKHCCSLLYQPLSQW